MEGNIKMHIRLSSGGLYFPKEELEREIASKGDVKLSSKEEIMEAIRETTGFSVVGYLNPSLTEEMVGRTGVKIYVVRLVVGQYCFCLPCGRVVHRSI